MATALVSPDTHPPIRALATGLKMTREQFLRVWDRLPELKNAELIDGVVYVASPVGADHGKVDTFVHWWLKSYALATPGVEAGNNITWMMRESAPQPDCHLCIAPGLGGSARQSGLFYQGAPELAIEITDSSRSLDFGAKLTLYARAGVKEYITFEPLFRRILWRRLSGGKYTLRKPAPGGLYRSACFPGLWLDPAAFWADDGARLKAALDQGLASPAHARFVRRLKSSGR